MKTLLVILLLSMVAGCTTDPQVAREKEMTRRYNYCMKQQLGAFGSFASPESRRKAADICQKVITPQ